MLFSVFSCCPVLRDGVQFNLGATGREVGTSPERAAAHPRSDEFSRQEKPRQEEIERIN